ncbi:MAG: hypothetical protein M4579_006139, partial [Chaenotheca gracillima]
DLRLLTSARHEARKGFETKRNLTPDDPQLATSIRHAEDVARILRQNIVQGQQVQGEQGENYSESDQFPSGLTQDWLSIVWCGGLTLVRDARIENTRGYGKRG